MTAKHRIFTAIAATAGTPPINYPSGCIPTISVGPRVAWEFLTTGQFPAWFTATLPRSPAWFFWDLEPHKDWHPFTESRATALLKHARALYPNARHLVYGQHHVAGWWAHDVGAPQGFAERSLRFADLGDSGSRAFCQQLDANCAEIYPFDGVYQSPSDLYRYAFRCTAYALGAGHGKPVVPTVSLRLVQHEIKPPDAGRFLTDSEWDATVRGIAEAGGGIWINGERVLCVAWDWLDANATALSRESERILHARYGTDPVAFPPAGDAT